MTWVDLGALTIMLWGAVKGYVSGAWHALMNVFMFIAAIMSAVFLHRPLAAYLRAEWQADVIFVGLSARNVDTLLETGTAGSPVFPQSPLTGMVIRLLSKDTGTIPVINQEMALAALVELAVGFFALAAILLLMAGSFSLLLRVRYPAVAKTGYRESQRILGLLLGAARGLLLSLVLCVALDAVSYFTLSGFPGNDLYHSYLFELAMQLVKFV